jgi:hypothetical protein
VRVLGLTSPHQARGSADAPARLQQPLPPDTDSPEALGSNIPANIALEFSVGETRAAREISAPAAACAKDLPQGVRRTQRPACRPRVRRSRPDSGSLPQRGALADPSAPEQANAFQAPPCAPSAALHHRSVAARRPGANRNTHGNEKRLLSISKSLPNICSWSVHWVGSELPCK